MDGTIFNRRGIGHWLTGLLARFVEAVARNPYDAADPAWLSGDDMTDDEMEINAYRLPVDRYRELAPAVPAVAEWIEFVNGR